MFDSGKSSSPRPDYGMRPLITSQTERYAHLDGLRGIAALNVILSHAIVAFDFAIYTGAAQESHGTWEVAISTWPFLLPVAGANFSVCVFFVLSGFVLANAFSGSRLGMIALAIKRTIRLGLPILVVTLLSWAILASGLMSNHAAAVLTRSSWLDTQMQQTASLWAALREGAYGSLIKSTIFTTTYDSSLWTMSIEFTGSILLIVLFGISKHFGIMINILDKRLIGMVLMAMGVVLQPFYISLIVFGAAIRMLEPRRLLADRTQPNLVAGLVLVSLILGTVPYSAERGPWWDRLIALAPYSEITGFLWHAGAGFVKMDKISIWHGIGAILLVISIELNPALQRLLSSRFPLRLGLISFPLYLIHIPVLMSVGCGVFLLAQRAGVAYEESVALATAIYMLVAIGLAALAVGLVERPAVRLSSRAAKLAQDGVQRAMAAAHFDIHRERH